MPAPLQIPEGRRDLIPITLFPNRGRGMGYAVTREGVGLGPGGEPEEPEGYHRTVNMICRDGRLLVPQFSPDGWTVPSEERAPFLASWTDTEGGPVVLFPVRRGADSYVYRYRRGELVTETDATTAWYGTAAFHDDGTGTPYLYAGTVTGSRLLQRRTQGGVWAEATGVVAMHVTSAAGALWASSSDYEIRKCPAGSDPFVASNWGAAIRVGSADARILRLGHLGAAPVVFKEDGLYVYDEQSNRFENRYPVPRSPDNFPFVTEDGEGGLLTSVADGSVVWLRQSGAIATIHPLRQAFPWRDTPAGVIRDIAISGRYWYALMDQRLPRVQPQGLVVKRTMDFQTYMTPTGLQDGYWQTTATLAQYAGENILIGFDDQFVAVWFLLAQTNTASLWLTAYVSTGGTDAGATWVQSQVWDGTAKRAADGAVVQSLALSEGSVVFEPPSFWAKATLGGDTKYWLRLQLSAAPSPAVLARDVAISPRRPGPPFTSDWRFVLEASGVYPKLLRGELNRARDTIVWDDVATIFSLAPAARVLAARTGSFQDSIVVLDLSRVGAYPQGDPSLAHYGPTGRDAVYACGFFPSAVDLSGGLYTLERVECFGSNFDWSNFRFAFRWDDTAPWTVTPLSPGPYARFDFTAGPGNQGSLLHTAIEVGTDVRGPAAPVIHRVVAWVRPVPGPRWGQPQRAIPQEV